MTSFSRSGRKLACMTCQISMPNAPSSWPSYKFHCASDNYAIMTREETVIYNTLSESGFHCNPAGITDYCTGTEKIFSDWCKAFFILSGGTKGRWRARLGRALAGQIWCVGGVQLAGHERVNSLDTMLAWCLDSWCPKFDDMSSDAR